MKIFRSEFDIFLIFAQNIDCGYTLEPPRRFGQKLEKYQNSATEKFHFLQLKTSLSIVRACFHNEAKLHIGGILRYLSQLT